jgi:hypothetical protein
MLEVKVSLDFACCCCTNPVGVTVKCEGKGLAAGLRAVASVNVPCPHCGSVNQLCFEPCGIVRSVAPYAGSRACPEPSVN